MSLRRSSLLSSSLCSAALALSTLCAAEEPAALSAGALVDAIRQSSPELKFYEAELQAARAAVRAAGARSDPELAVQLGRKRAKDRRGELEGEGTAWSVSLTQTFEWPGRLALRKAIANGQVELAELGLARFRAALEARARLLAQGLHAGQAKADAVREVADRFAALKETFLAREPGGITPQLETRVIEASELSLQRRATDAELELHAALVELNQLRGADAEEPLAVRVSTLSFGNAPPADQLRAAARENNFDYRMRRSELEQQGFEVRLARTAGRPAVSVTPFYAAERAGAQETTVGIGVSLPLPVSGQARSGVAVTEARRRQAEAATLVAERELDRDVAIAAETFARKAAEVRRWKPGAIESFREAAALADRHYRLGAVPIATYVELQNSYLEAVETLLETQREALAAALKLEQLTGATVLSPEVNK